MPTSIFLTLNGSGQLPAGGAIGIGAAPVAGNGIFIQNTTLVTGIRIEPTGVDAHQPMMVFQRSNGTVTGMIDEIGTFRTNLSISVSGSMTATLNADGSILSRSSGVTGLSDMIDVVGDTTYGVVSKASSVPGQNYTGLDSSGNLTWNVDQNGVTQWGTSNLASVDTSLQRRAAGVVCVGNGTAGTNQGTFEAGIVRNLSTTNGQAISDLQTLTELTTIAAAASTDTTIQMPAAAVILGVCVRTTVVIPTATSYSVGDSGSATRFNTANVGVAAGSTDPGTKAGAYYNASALSVRLTMNGGTPAANTGRVRVTIFYYSITPPTS